MVFDDRNTVNLCFEVEHFHDMDFADNLARAIDYHTACSLYGVFFAVVLNSAEGCLGSYCKPF